nr:hypothetical protein [Salinispora tropica]
MVSDGVTYAGRRRLTPAPPGPYTWTDLSGNANYPGESVCGVAISAAGNDAWVKVLTTGGEVWETECATQGQNFTCNNPWVQLTTPS